MAISTVELSLSLNTQFPLIRVIHTRSAKLFVDFIYDDKYEQEKGNISLLFFSRAATPLKAGLIGPVPDKIAVLCNLGV